MARTRTSRTPGLAACFLIGLLISGAVCKEERSGAARRSLLADELPNYEHLGTLKLPLTAARVMSMTARDGYLWLATGGNVIQDEAYIIIYKDLKQVKSADYKDQIPYFDGIAGGRPGGLLYTTGPNKEGSNMINVIDSSTLEYQKTYEVPDAPYLAPISLHDNILAVSGGDTIHFLNPNKEMKVLSTFTVPESLIIALSTDRDGYIFTGVPTGDVPVRAAPGNIYAGITKWQPYDRASPDLKPVWTNQDIIPRYEGIAECPQGGCSLVTLHPDSATETERTWVHVLNDKGELVDRFGGPNVLDTGAGAIAADPTGGYIYVADNAAEVVHVFRVSMGKPMNAQGSRDPHFKGFDGKEFHWHGKPNTVATLLASPGQRFSLETLLQEGRLPGTTFMHEIVFKHKGSRVKATLEIERNEDGQPRLRVNAYANGKRIESGTVTLPGGIKVSRRSPAYRRDGKVVIQAGFARLVIWQRWREDRRRPADYLNFDIFLYQPLALPVSGVLAPSYRVAIKNNNNNFMQAAAGAAGAALGASGDGDTSGAAPGATFGFPDSSADIISWASSN